MRTDRAIYGGIIGFCLGAVVPHYGHWPNLYYDPAARSFFFGHPLSPVPIVFYGLLAYALMFGLLGSFVAERLRLGHAPSGDKSYALGSAWALTSVVLAVAYYTFAFWP